MALVQKDGTSMDYIAMTDFKGVASALKPLGAGDGSAHEDVSFIRNCRRLRPTSGRITIGDLVDGGMMLPDYYLEIVPTDYASLPATLVEVQGGIWSGEPDIREGDPLAVALIRYHAAKRAQRSILALITVGELDGFAFSDTFVELSQSCEGVSL